MNTLVASFTAGGYPDFLAPNFDYVGGVVANGANQIGVLHSPMEFLSPADPLSEFRCITFNHTPTFTLFFSHFGEILGFPITNILGIRVVEFDETYLVSDATINNNIPGEDLFNCEWALQSNFVVGTTYTLEITYRPRTYFMTPLNLRFDGVANVQGSNIVRLPKICQGAPYLFGLRVRMEDGVTYRSWTSIPQMRWRIKLRPADKDEIFVLLKSDGNFTITENDTLNFKIKADDWEGVTLPNSANHLEMDVPFSHVVEFLDAYGVVTERFAQGSGLISVDLNT